MSSEKAPRRGRMVRNLMHLGLGQIATTVLSILLSAAMGRTLGAADFGLWFLATTIATFAFVIVDWGHGSYIIRETARSPGRAGNLLGSALALRTVATLIICVVAIATTWLLKYDVRTRVLTGLLILGMLPQYLGLSFGWVFRAYERMDRDAMLNVALKLSTLLGSMACLALGGRLFGLVFVCAVSGCLTLAIAVSVYRRLHFPPLSATVSTSRELLRGGASLFTMSVAVAVEPYFNTNILYNMSSPEVVGWYGAAWNIAGTLIAPATILGTTMYPRLSMAASDAVEFKRVFDVSFRPLFLLAVLGAVGTFLFADVAVGLIYGLQKFAGAADTVRAFAPALLLMYVDFFLASAIIACGKAGRLAGMKVAAVVLTTVLVLILVPFCQARLGNGGLGVMYSMAIGELLMLIPATMLMREVVDRSTVSEVIRCLVAGTATIMLIRLLPSLAPFFAIPLCVLAFGGLSWLVGAVKRSDFDMLLASFRKTPSVPIEASDAIGPSSK